MRIIYRSNAIGLIIAGVATILFVDFYPHFYQKGLKDLPYIEGKLSDKDTQKVVENPYGPRSRTEYYQIAFVVDNKATFFINKPSEYEARSFRSKLKYDINYRFYSAPCEYNKEACPALAIKNMERNHFLIPYRAYVNRNKSSDKSMAFGGFLLVLLGTISLSMSTRKSKKTDS